MVSSRISTEHTQYASTWYGPGQIHVPQPLEVRTIIATLLKMWKLTNREVRKLAEGQATRGSMTSKLAFLATTILPYIHFWHYLPFTKITLASDYILCKQCYLSLSVSVNLLILIFFDFLDIN